MKNLADVLFVDVLAGALYEQARQNQLENRRPVAMIGPDDTLAKGWDRYKTVMGPSLLAKKVKKVLRENYGLQKKDFGLRPVLLSKGRASWKLHLTLLSPPPNE